MPGEVGAGRLREIVEARVHDPEAVRRAAALRTRAASLVGATGRALVIAADHPARGAMGAGSRPMAMADRADLLDRVCTALTRPGVTGVLGTPDILDDLLLLGALDGKTVFGSMNRGGISGASFEMDDRFTAYDAAGIAGMGFDGGKMLLRVDYRDNHSAATLQACAAAVRELSAARLVAMVEPFLVRRSATATAATNAVADTVARNDLSPEAMATAISIASGLGSLSAYTWLKVPVVANLRDMERVMAASTLPALLLGGEPGHDPAAVYERWAEALRLPTVTGLVVGRSLLYPADDDVVSAVDTVARML